MKKHCFSRNVITVWCLFMREKLLNNYGPINQHLEKHGMDTETDRLQHSAWNYDEPCKFGYIRQP